MFISFLEYSGLQLHLVRERGGLGGGAKHYLRTTYYHSKRY